jgi:hypothetical protein
MKTSTESVYVIFDAQSDLQSLPHPLVRKLRGFADLPEGWSHGEGIAVSGPAIRCAEDFVQSGVAMQLDVDVFPGLNGDCSVAFYDGPKSVEVIVHSNGTLAALHVEHGVGFGYKTIEAKDAPSYAETMKRILALLPEAWKSPASFRSFSSTSTSAGSQTLYSSTHQAVA